MSVLSNKMFNEITRGVHNEEIFFFFRLHRWDSVRSDDGKKTVAYGSSTETYCKTIHSVIKSEKVITITQYH